MVSSIWDKFLLILSLDLNLKNGRIANREDLDQTAQEQSHLDLHCLPRQVCPSTVITTLLIRVIIDLCIIILSILDKL